MAIFAVLLPMRQPALEDAIKTAFPTEHLYISDTQWLISAAGTQIEIAAKLGIYEVNEPLKPSTGNAIVFGFSVYFGRAPTTVWDWIKAKLEVSSGG